MVGLLWDGSDRVVVVVVVRGGGGSDCERREKVLLIIIDTPRTMTPVVQIADEFSERSRC